MLKDRQFSLRIDERMAEVIEWVMNRFGMSQPDAVRFLLEHGGASLQTIFQTDPKNHGKLQRDMVIDQMSESTRQEYVKELVARLGGAGYITELLKGSSWRADIYNYAKDYDDEMPSNRGAVKSAFQYLDSAILKALNLKDIKHLQESLRQKCRLVDECLLSKDHDANGSQTLTSHKELLRSIWEQWEESDLEVLNLGDIEALSTILHANAAMIDEFLSVLERMWKKVQWERREELNVVEHRRPVDAFDGRLAKIITAANGRKLHECERCLKSGFPDHFITFEKEGYEPATGRILWKFINEDGSEHVHKGQEEKAKQQI